MKRPRRIEGVGGRPATACRPSPPAASAASAADGHGPGAHHLEHPEWENGFDLAAETARATRRSLLDRAVSEDMRVMAFHFPFPSVGRVAARPDGGWAWTPGW